MTSSPQQSQPAATSSDQPLSDSLPVSAACSPDAAEHCLTCGDVAVSVRVVQVNVEQGTALVTVESTTEEIDISLLDSVAVGDTVLVHGGVALERCGLSMHGEEVDVDD
ncbi:hypothetical protein KDW_52860 [Dictyobacter vulcani]|uniref:Hydrogenase assembly protein HupF n=1 Tax=Dictyobacter vulcani TaxID=2607529 RepID=A0A5J4KP22_9CHLR|nr:HypC/HybG/HupF family hydrogenase formation chaperone [Dictyobacter vulcani]GER91124.1 hypothetical protein KDW_52860 [Dictyobacter vulcani]